MVRQVSPGPPQSASLAQKRGESPATRTKSNGGAPSFGTSSSPLLTQMLFVQGPPGPHSSLFAQAGGTPSLLSGKYCRPMPMFASLDAWTNDSSDWRTASHFVIGALSFALGGRSSSIDPEMSSITYMSSPIGSACSVSPRHCWL